MDGTADRTAAHAGVAAIPGLSACASCHAAIATSVSGSLHTTLDGFEAVLGARGVGFDPVASATAVARYVKQCARCHLANDAGAGACGHCHISVPASAGGGLVKGHRIERTPDTVNNCTACHGSRVKDEYFGQNTALYQRNRKHVPALAASDPFFASTLTTLAPDVHRAAGWGCERCHSGAEMHGAGVSAGIDRYGVTGTPSCRSAACHGTPANAGAAAGFHSGTHLAAMSCHVCHAQPYKQCFGCHTEETASGAGYFSNNESDPTRAARFVDPSAWTSTTVYAKDAWVTRAAATYRSLQAANLNHAPDEAGSAWWQAGTPPRPPGDALITFRVGNNPRFGVVPGAPRYAVLRHVPVDPAVFEYSGTTAPAVPGLIPDMTAAPTWKYATPHNIQRSTAVTRDPDGAGPQTACGNCHSDRYARFWLTSAVGDAWGWVPDPALPANAFFQFEVDANTSVVQTGRPTATTMD